MSETHPKGTNVQMQNNVTNLHGDYRTTPPPPMTDSQLAAYWASQALGEGRIDLGLSLARLAVQARTAEQAAEPVFVPMAGQTRDEQPRAVELAPATQIFEKVSDEVQVGSRCDATVVILGVEGSCSEAIMWNGASWAHINPQLDAAHAAVIMRDDVR